MTNTTTATIRSQAAAILNNALAGAYGNKTAIAILASLSNDLGYRCAANIMNPPKAKPVPGFAVSDDGEVHQTAYDAASVGELWGIDGIEERPPVSLSELALAFSCAQWLVIDAANAPDPEQIGGSNLWAKKYCKNAQKLIDGEIERRIKARMKARREEVEKMRAAVPVQFDEEAFQRAVIAEMMAHRDEQVRTLDQEFRALAPKAKAMDPEDQWETICALYEKLDVSMAARIYESVLAILGVQAKRLSSNPQWTRVDSGLISFKQALDALRLSVPGKTA